MEEFQGLCHMQERGCGYGIFTYPPPPVIKDLLSQSFAAQHILKAVTCRARVSLGHPSHVEPGSWQTLHWYLHIGFF